MKYLNYYKERKIKEDDVFNYFITNLKPSIKVWDYFVNWAKVNHNIENLIISLNLLNSVIGSDNFKKDFLYLIKKYPEIVKTFPALLAVRENKLEIFKNYKKQDLDYLLFNFKNIKKISDEDAENYYFFIEKSGLINLFKDKKIKNFVDYVYGVEVGLDSNGRKNRGGTLMEDIIEVFVKKFSEESKFEYLSQATPKKIKENWNIEVKYEKSARSFDFAIYDKKKNKLTLIETNFYNGGGSKLKSVCGEFKTLFNELQKQNIELIWITDGFGWESTKRPLEETFNNNHYVFNLKMLEEGVLEEVFSLK